MCNSYRCQRLLVLMRGRPMMLTLALALVLTALLAVRLLAMPATASASDAQALQPWPGSNLAGSYKSASQCMLAPGEILTYTIHLRNSGLIETAAQVTDELPAEVNYVPGSASGGGVYDPGTGALSWSDVMVPAGGNVPLSFAVTTMGVVTPTVVTNTAIITADGEALERWTWVLLMPEHPAPCSNLAGSYKSASQHTLAPGERLTYTIHLHNSGTAGAVAQVTDQLPAEVNYVPGSAMPGAVYDAGAGTLSWSDVAVSVWGDVSLSFAVTTTAVTRPTVVTNTATISADGDLLERHAWVLLVPEPLDPGSVPPVVHSLTIDEWDVLTSPTVTLHISATDDVGVRWMYLREWQWATTPWPHWEVAQSSGWVPYQAEYPWTLGSESGTHFVGVWVADSALNTSQLDMRGLDFASLLQPGATVPQFGVSPYLVYYEAGLDVSAVLTPTAGDVDLYVWYTGVLTKPTAMAAEVVTFTTESAGTYLFLVHGEPGATYDLSIEPPGGPRQPVSGMAQARAGSASQGVSGEADDLISILTQSGLDPLGSAETPSGPFVVYLPMVVK